MKRGRLLHHGNPLCQGATLPKAQPYRALQATNSLCAPLRAPSAGPCLYADPEGAEALAAEAARLQGILDSFPSSLEEDRQLLEVRRASACLRSRGRTGPSQKSPKDLWICLSAKGSPFLRPS